ncbi:hypothetical protein HZB74_01130 [Candidatus Saccharibacteria bacterium]|nr:hypothetical protein [Candidatus Saccharibacteria bacterium]
MASNNLLRQARPHLIAHRGGNLAGENSKKAFRGAVSLGFSFLETDVILTKDGRLISYHGSKNSYMRKKSGLEKRGLLQKLSLAEINDLLFKNQGEVPLMEDVLNTFPECFFSIDAKTSEVVEPLAELINRTNSSHRVSLGSFSLRRSVKLAKLIKSKDEKATGLCLYRVQAYPAMVFAPIVFSFLRKKGIRVVHIPYKCVNKRILKIAHSQKILIYAWSVNEEDEIKRLISIGTDGIISDDIKLLKKLTS